MPNNLSGLINTKQIYSKCHRVSSLLFLILEFSPGLTATLDKPESPRRLLNSPIFLDALPIRFVKASAF